MKSRPRSLTARALLSACLLAPVATATDSTTTPTTEPRLDLTVQRATLENGLRVVMHVDKSSPTVALCVTYDVGSRNEQPGRSGFAHLFEHMMFQGSRNLAKGDHFRLISSRGGSLNGTTSGDRTNYYETLPSNGLALGLWLEADRMKSLAVNQDNFENQRKVVQEEYRMRVSNHAYATGHMALSELVFEGYFPYGHDAIGSMTDLDAAKLPWIRDFHGQYYAPNNAVLAISGDFDTDEAMRIIHDVFGSARRVEPPRYSPAPLPAQTAPRRAKVTDANVKTHGIFMGWSIPEFRTAEHYALELATLVLGVGESSRLHQRLVRELDLASSAAAWTGDHRGPDVFALRVLLSERAEPAVVEQRIEEEIARLGRSKVSDQELTKAKNRLKSFFLFGLESNQSRASQLANYELFYGDARLLSRELDAYLRVTPEQIQAAAAKYLIPSRSSVVIVEPPTTSNGARVSE